MSRKRPAPEMPNPYVNLPPNAAYGSHGTDLSNDQFLQWSEELKNDAQPQAVYNDPSLFAANTFPPTPNMTPSTQLMRTPQTPQTQLITRPRTHNEINGDPWVQDHGVNNSNVQRNASEKDDLPLLQVRALEAKKVAQAKRKQIPPFVQKLSSFLDQSKNTELIRWSDDGKSFIVLDEDEFAKTLIPELFKHNNYASFVRQLNMYGFHKKVGLADNSMRASERKNKSPSEYSHDFFRRGHPELLWAIQKPKNTTGSKAKNRNKEQDIEGDDTNEEYIEEIPSGVQAPRPRLAIEQAAVSSPDGQQLVQLVQNELRTIRAQQAAIARTIQELRQEHQTLANQAMTFQEQHSRHENSINAILSFLATVYQNSVREGGANLNSLFNGGAIPPETNQGNVVDVGDYNFEQDTNDNDLHRYKKPQLLLKAAPTVVEPPGRAATMSPSVMGSPYSRKSSQGMRNGHSPGTVEEIYEPNMQGNQGSANQLGRNDIMSVIQDVNARNPVPGFSSNDFPAVLNSLETAGGNGPLSPAQRENMLRMINNSSNQSGNTNNALVSPTPPPMPAYYANRLADTRTEIDRLARMQAEQDQSVQNLERLLQPLSPNGGIPGISGEQEVPLPPGLDLDEIFKTSDYFNGPDGSMYDAKPAVANQNSGYNPDVYQDDELFGNVNPAGYNNQAQHLNGSQYNMYKPDNEHEQADGRVESVASSEPSTPATTLDTDTNQIRNTATHSNVADVDTALPRKRRRNGL